MQMFTTFKVHEELLKLTEFLFCGLTREGAHIIYRKTERRNRDPHLPALTELVKGVLLGK